MGLFLDEGSPFLIYIKDFLDYFKRNASDSDYLHYSDEKGKAFEQMVYEIIKQMFQESYHTLYYYLSEKQKIESDVLLRDKDNITFFRKW